MQSTLKPLRTHVREVFLGGAPSLLGKLSRSYRLLDYLWSQVALWAFRRSMYRTSVAFLNLMSIKSQALRVQSSAPIIHEISTASHEFYRHEAPLLRHLAQRMKITDFTGKSVLFLGSNFQYGLPGVQSNLSRLLELSARELQIKYQATYCEEWSNSDKSDVRSFLGSLISSRNATHLMISDHLLLQSSQTPWSHHLLEAIAVLKQKQGLTVQVLVGDPHSTQARKQVAPYEEVADGLICMSSWSSLYSEKDLDTKLKGTLSFVDGAHFRPQEKTLDLFFAGFYLLDRHRLASIAGSFAYQNRLSAVLHLGNPPPKHGNCLSDNDYQRFMGSARAVLNMSTKGSGSQRVAIINGRTWEAFAARAALIQYSPPENESLVLDEFFTPGEEYFQFSSEAELVQILSLFKKDPQRIEDVARRGHERYLRDYSARPGWARLLM